MPCLSLFYSPHFWKMIIVIYCSLCKFSLKCTFMNIMFLEFSVLTCHRDKTRHRRNILTYGKILKFFVYHFVVVVCAKEKSKIKIWKCPEIFLSMIIEIQGKAERERERDFSTEKHNLNWVTETEKIYKKFSFLFSLHNNIVLNGITLLLLLLFLLWREWDFF